MKNRHRQTQLEDALAFGEGLDRSSTNNAIPAIPTGSGEPNTSGCAKPHDVAPRGLRTHLPMTTNVRRTAPMARCDSVKKPSLSLVQGFVYWVIYWVTYRVIYTVILTPILPRRLHIRRIR